MTNSFSFLFCPQEAKHPAKQRSTSTNAIIFFILIDHPYLFIFFFHAEVRLLLPLFPAKFSAVPSHCSGRPDQKLFQAPGRQLFSNMYIPVPPEKTKILSRNKPSVAGTGKIPAVPPCLTENRPLMRTIIRRPFFTEGLSLRLPYSRTRNPLSAPLSGRPRKSIQSCGFCRNSTACSSLEERKQNLLTLPHRFTKV